MDSTLEVFFLLPEISKILLSSFSSEICPPGSSITLNIMTNITPFKITVPASKIARLQQKLALTDFPDELVDNEPWIYGTPLSDLKELAHYWEKTFDWRTVEASLNKFPQYIANVEVEGFNTYDVHFIHQPSSAENAVPLLFIHGWPGSFIEVTKMLPDLVKESNGNPSFHVVAPSLIDFGFSSPSRKVRFAYEVNVHADEDIERVRHRTTS